MPWLVPFMIIKQIEQNLKRLVVILCRCRRTGSFTSGWRPWSMLCSLVHFLSFSFLVLFFLLDSCEQRNGLISPVWCTSTQPSCGTTCADGKNWQNEFRDEWFVVLLTVFFFMLCFSLCSALFLVGLCRPRLSTILFPVSLSRTLQMVGVHASKATDSPALRVFVVRFELCVDVPSFSMSSCLSSRPSPQWEICCSLAILSFSCLFLFAVSASLLIAFVIGGTLHVAFEIIVLLLTFSWEYSGTNGGQRCLCVRCSWFALNRQLFLVFFPTIVSNSFVCASSNFISMLSLEGWMRFSLGISSCFGKSAFLIFGEGWLIEFVRWKRWIFSVELCLFRCKRCMLFLVLGACEHPDFNFFPPRFVYQILFLCMAALGSCQTFFLSTSASSSPQPLACQRCTISSSWSFVWHCVTCCSSSPAASHHSDLEDDSYSKILCCMFIFPVPYQIDILFVPMLLQASIFSEYVFRDARSLCLSYFRRWHRGAELLRRCTLARNRLDFLRKKEIVLAWRDLLHENTWLK